MPDKEKKINLNFYFHTLCGALKGFMKALKAFIKPFEAPQRSVKIKVKLIFIQLAEMYWAGRVKKCSFLLIMNAALIF